MNATNASILISRGTMLTRRLSAWNREVAGAAILAVFFGCMVESGIARSHKESLSYIDAFSLCHQAEPMSSQNQKDDHGVVPNSHQPGILDFEKEWQEDLHPEDTSRFQLVKQVRSMLCIMTDKDAFNIR